VLKTLRMLGTAAIIVTTVSCAPQVKAPLAPTPRSAHVAPDANGALGRLAAAVPLQRDSSAIRVLDTGRDAFLERAALIEAAERSIDAQYYIWNSDNTGVYLANRLQAAAERGVRVRLLLDDINVAERDAAIARLDAHPNIEIRIYNPFAYRKGLARTFNFLSEFTRLNRRMHNKSFTIDGIVTIVGGRNIGDEYFDSNPQLNFRDRDVVAIGPVAGESGEMFDTFWNAALSRPISELAGPDDGRAGHGPSMEDAARTLAALHGALPKRGDDALSRIRSSFDAMRVARARLVHDAPPALDKFGDTDGSQPSARALAELAAGVREEILIESAYLVLDDDSMERIAALAGRGVRVRALTNSLASNDVTANHAAYARRRSRMLESGLEIHELRPDAASCRTLVMNDAACAAPHVFGLHAKTFVLDRSTVYVGSLNLNLRSRYLNAESGMIIESAELAQSVAAAIELNMEPGNSWRVERQPNGALIWRGGDGTEWHEDPMTPWSRRVIADLIATLPLEKYL